MEKTVQVIPHITDEIKKNIREASEDADLTIVEVGGTVGDIEGLPFLEAIRQLRHEEGQKNTLFVHLTLVPYIGVAGELKTKPTQHSVKELREIGNSTGYFTLSIGSTASPRRKRKNWFILQSSGFPGF